ncbi:MAG: flagellar biosynthetic protein FliR [Bryobacteraceae bacterium]
MTVPVNLILGFLAVLARVSGAFLFVPLPGMKQAPAIARIVLSLSVATVVWVARPGTLATHEFAIGEPVALILSEAALGISIGVAVALLGECLSLAAQMIGLQAGFSYASTIDPTSDADSGVLLVFSQLVSWWLLFATGFEAYVIRAFARSFELYPPGGFAVQGAAVEAVLRLGSVVLAAAFRLALPILAMLVLVDVTFALLARVNAHLQLLSLAFPVKLLASIALLAMLAGAFPKVYGDAAAQAASTISRIAGAGREGR